MFVIRRLRECEKCAAVTSRPNYAAAIWVAICALQLLIRIPDLISPGKTMYCDEKLTAAAGIAFYGTALLVFLSVLLFDKTFLTEKGIMKFGAFFGRNSFTYAVKNEENENGKSTTELEIYTKKSKPALRLKIKNRKAAYDVLRYYKKHEEGVIPAGKVKFYAPVQFAADILIGAVVVAAAYLIYISDPPFIMLGGRAADINEKYIICENYNYFSEEYYKNYFNRFTLDNGDLSKLKKLTKLECLVICNNNITRLDEIGELSGLKKLCIGQTNGKYPLYEDYSPLKKLTELEYFAGLDLYNFSDYGVFEKMNKLKELSLSGMDIPESGMDVICGKKLEDLRFSECVSGSYSKLADCIELKELVLDGSDVYDISFISSMKELEKLALDDTKVTDLSPLRSLPKLEVLSINGLEIDDYSVLEELPALNAVYGDIPGETAEALKSRGVTIY